MAQRSLSVSDFLKQVREAGTTLIDVRSEGEFGHAHIPGAINLPILNNEERKVVGTIYKQHGREAAVKKGFELVGPRFHTMIEAADTLITGKNVLLYCWRGGMRSNILSWVLSLAGFKVSLLEGGYKAFRNHALKVLQEPRVLRVLGGKTGSGKTEILRQLALTGEQVIDLEGIASHKGSAFGGIGMPAQPTNEQFENLLAWHWETTDPDAIVWVENESRHIGTCMLPENIYTLMRESDLVEVDIPAEHRKKRITADYGRFPKEDLAAATERISKRLGPQHTKAALEFLHSDNFDAWLDIVLAYYDKLYSFGTSTRNQERVIRVQVLAGDTETAIININSALHSNHNRSSI